MKKFVRWRCHALLLLLWLIVGTGLRFTQLAAKPPWTDEFATLVFSLGHSFEGVPLNQAIALEKLLQPLHLEPEQDLKAVVYHLLTEDVHPPLYFVLAHAWMNLFAANGGLASIWAARALPALLGAVSIPATFGLGWLAFRSPTVGQLAAAMMAVSPFGVYLSQEARHYTLAILWVIASLSCFIVALRFIHRRIPLPMWVIAVWVGVNGLGIATHYFFLLTLGAIALVLLGRGIAEARKDPKFLLKAQWRRIYMVAMGTAMTGLVWVPIWQSIQNREITQWIQSSDRFGVLPLLNPIFQSLAAWITMLVLLPIESRSIPVVVGFGLVMGLFLVWVVPILRQGLKMQQSDPQNSLSVQVFKRFVLGAIALFFLITYGLGADLTRGARYSFVYFPAVIVLIGASLAACWHRSSSEAAQSDPWSWGKLWRARGKTVVLLIWLVGLTSGLTVAGNLGYQKYYRPDVLVPLIQKTSQNLVLIATTHSTLVQVGEMMGLGWQFHQEEDITSPVKSPLFLLAHITDDCRDCSATTTLQQVLAALPTPVDLWLVNFHAPADLESRGCIADTQPRSYISGYSYQLYRCP